MTVIVTKTFTTICPGELADAIELNVAITPVLEQIIYTGGTTCDFYFATALLPAEDTELDSILASWVCPATETSTPELDDLSALDDAATGPTVLWSADQIQAAISASSNSTGPIIQLSFALERSSIRNRWLSHHGDSSLTSDRSPAIVPFGCTLVGVTFTNRVTGVDQDVQINVSAAGDPPATITTAYTQAIRNQRFVADTTMTGVNFNAGDKIGVYLMDQGTNASYVSVILFLQVTDNTPALHEENISGDM